MLPAIVTPENFKKFKRLYLKALKNNQDQFVFEGNDVLVAYAKYMVEYCDTRWEGVL
jgi:hypothetical protein